MTKVISFLVVISKRILLLQQNIIYNHLIIFIISTLMYNYVNTHYDGLRHVIYYNITNYLYATLRHLHTTAICPNENCARNEHLFNVLKSQNRVQFSRIANLKKYAGSLLTLINN